MNVADTLAECYIQQFWPEKPEPMKEMIRMAYTAGFYSFRGQVAAMALQGMLTNSIITMSDREYIANTSVEMADALISELNKKR